MSAVVQTFKCPHCGYVVRARAAKTAWHPCPQRLTKTGKRQMVEMEENE